MQKRLDKQKTWNILYDMLRGGAVVARQAHNLKAVGSIPAPATNNYSASQPTGFFCAVKVLTTKDFAKL